MKVVYCSNCGTKLHVTRKALKKYSKIIDIVEYHECPDEPVELDLTPVDVPLFMATEGKDKFVKKMNDLSPTSILGSLGTHALRDRRFEELHKEQPKDKFSSAPQALLNQIEGMIGTAPAHKMEDPDEE